MNTSKIAIVTDSTADLPEDVAKKSGIHVIANLVVVDGVAVEDGKGLSRQDFYSSLPKMKNLPTTATASAGVYHQLYEKLFQQGINHIISIHPPLKLSGIINAANMAAITFNKRVSVIDSETVSLGLGFQAIAAAEAAARGAALETILSIIIEMKKRIRLVAMLDTLEYLRRSGRVNWARARLGDLISIKPFVEVKMGQVFSLGETRTYRKGFVRMLDMLRSLGPLERLAILHTNAENTARQLLDTYCGHFPFEPLIINVTTVIGSHVGPNGLGFIAVLQKPPVLATE
ncbi:MAG: DegV family protein [Anaerolineales bacterium]|nr:DegV family protein [Anaerolineales bacterium]